MIGIDEYRRYLDRENSIEKVESDLARLYGISGIVCLIAGFFMNTLIMWTLGIILGYLAYRKGSKKLKMTSVILNLVMLLFVLGFGDLYWSIVTG